MQVSGATRPYEAERLLIYDHPRVDHDTRMGLVFDFDNFVRLHITIECVTGKIPTGLWNTEQAAEFLSISPEMLRRW